MAQQVQAGTLECRGGPDTGFIVGSVTNLNCVLHVDSAPDSRYIAAIQNFDVFIGDTDVALNWKVMAEVPWLAPDGLAGTYTHAEDAGINVLGGGANGPITLSPPTRPNDGSPPPANIESLELRPMDR
ncbi:DUF992 domain-containing protein [Bradyrhizobium macuxiense]|uniref:DUF992 domain-containing protein n=1 Tax=Bradyrhizobium macuxiense TaxID=1755647 RepID=UPI001FDA2FB3